jgi:hypothetical protein
VQLSNVTPSSSAWTRFTTQLSPTTYAGRSVEVGFLATTDSAFVTSFLIDSASLTVTACPPGSGGTGTM